MIYYLGLVGIAAFSVTGVIAAGRKDMDIISIVLLGMVTALGGGTLRDIILGAHPVFWISDLMYLWVSIGAAIITFSRRAISITRCAFCYSSMLLGSRRSPCSPPRKPWHWDFPSRWPWSWAWSPVYPEVCYAIF